MNNANTITFDLIKNAAQYALENVKQTHKKEEYYDRLLHNYFGMNKFATMSMDFSIKHSVIGCFHENKPVKCAFESEYTTKIHPDLIIEDNNGVNFIEVKTFYNSIDCKAIEIKEFSELPGNSLEKQMSSASIYKIDGIEYKFFFKSGQIWSDIIRCLSIIKITSRYNKFYLLIYVIKAKCIDTIKETIESTINIINTDKTCYAYSPKVKRWNLKEKRNYIDKLHVDIDFTYKIEVLTSRIADSDCVVVVEIAPTAPMLN